MEEKEGAIYGSEEKYDEMDPQPGPVRPASVVGSDDAGNGRYAAGHHESGDSRTVDRRGDHSHDRTESGMGEQRRHRRTVTHTKETKKAAIPKRDGCFLMYGGMGIWQKKKERMTPLLQVCIRIRIPQLIIIVYHIFGENASPI